MTEVRKHIHGIIGAFLFKIITIALLLLFGFTTPLPLPPEEGILLDFGGGGNVNAGASSSASSNEQNASTQNSSNSGVNTQNFEDAASMQSSTIPNPLNPNTNNNTNNTESTSPSNPNADRLNNLFGGNVFGNGTGSGTSGDGSGSGNPGTGTGGDGSGTGPGGVGGSLDGRRQIKKVDPIAEANMFGRVVLKITVNEQGNVTDVSLVSSNCDRCVKAAIDAVKQWKYESKPGSGYQTGNVAIEFKQN
jgi:TonB family protein